MDSTALAICLAIFGVMLLIISYRRHHHHRLYSAIAHAIAGATLVIAGAWLLTFSLNLHTYEPVAGQPLLAEVSVSRVNKQHFQLSLMRIPSGELQVFTLSGQQWRIEARLLHWRGWTRWLGIDQHLRLEQLITELRPATKQALPAITRYALSHNPGINLWEWRQEHPSPDAWYDITLVQSVSLPLEDGLRFHVYLDGQQLLAKAVNRAPARSDGPPAETPVLNQRSIALLKGSNLTVQSASQSGAANSSVAAAASTQGGAAHHTSSSLHH